MCPYVYCFNFKQFGFPEYLSRDSKNTRLALTFFGHIHVTHFLWLKFVVIWRFYRLWAICDGIQVIENMQRCCHHTTNVSNFWRSWHSSFNHWNMAPFFFFFALLLLCKWRCGNKASSLSPLFLLRLRDLARVNWQETLESRGEKVKERKMGWPYAVYFRTLGRIKTWKLGKENHEYPMRI